jgi:membrane-associated phospholipid phosphatase
MAPPDALELALARVDASPRRLLRSRRLRAVARWTGPSAYAIAVTVEIATRGLPLMRDRVLLWVALGLVAFSLHRLRRDALRLLLDWLPFAAILLVYDLLRGSADGLLFRAHTWPQLYFDQELFGGVTPTVWLQHTLYHGPGALRWYDYGAWGVYLTHFFATLIVAMVLWLCARAQFRRYAAMVSLLALMGFATYALFPAVPPWMAAQQGALPPDVQRIIGAVFAHLPIQDTTTIFQRGTRYANDVAAMPSLHAAYSLLIALFLWPLARRWWWRAVLSAYPLAMGFALVYTGEHYVADVVAGWVYALIASLAVDAAIARMVAARLRRAAAVP